MTFTQAFSWHYVVTAVALIFVSLLNIEVINMQLSTFCSYLWVLSSSFVLGDQSYNWGSPSQWPSHTFGSSIPSAAASQASSQPQSLASTAASAVPSQSQSPASTSPTASQTYSSSAATYTNPIYNQFGADPWVVKNGNYYYMTYTTNDNVTILRSSVLTCVLSPIQQSLLTWLPQGLGQCRH